MLTLVLVLALQVSPAVQKKIDAARAAVEKAPEDAKANLELGKLLCFDAGDWAGGLAHLAKGADKDFAPVAEKDLAGGAALDRVEAAELWMAIGKKQKPIAAACTNRAMALYAEAWPGFEGGVKDKFREKMLALHRKAAPSKVLGPHPATGWGADNSNRRYGRDGEFSRTGAMSLKLIHPDPAITTYQNFANSDRITCKPGAKVVYSCWILTTGGDGAQEELRIKFRNATQGPGEHLNMVGVKGDSDRPFWTKIQGEITAPEGTAYAEISFKRNVGATKPAYVDDVSVLVDGKEASMNGSFEK